MPFAIPTKLTVTPRNALLGLAAAAALLAFAATIPAPALGQAKGDRHGWTRTLSVELSARDLGLRPGTPARKLARAALARHAARLGLPKSLRGVRVARTRHVPSGPRGAGELDLMRFQQTLRGTRVLWSQIDVTVAAGRVSSIAATVVPVSGNRIQGERRVSRSRALRIARRAVAGPEQALQPLPVAYAGKPTTGHNPRSRVPRRAWVVEVQPAPDSGAETPNPLCVVVDARTGKVIARWWGIADRPERGPHARGAQTASAEGTSAERAAARTAQLKTQLLLEGHDGTNSTDPLDGRTQYATFRVDTDPHRGVNWPALTNSPPWNQPCARFSSPPPCVHFRGQHTATAVLEATAMNARNVAFTICAVRDYCGNRGVPQGPQGFYGPWHVFANVNGSSRAFCSTLAVHIRAGAEMDVSGDPRPPFNDIIAHEFGHIRDCVSAGDRSSGGREIDEVEEALADMFAYDYDRDDATLAEDLAGGPSVDWQTPGNVLYSGQPQPDHMNGYADPPPGKQAGDPPDEHFNSTILSHAYHRFVQDVGHDRAGHVLQAVPSALSPKPGFKEVAQAFFNRAHALYGTEVSGPAANGFGQVGLPPITDPQPDPPDPPDDPDCGPEAC